MPAMLTTASSIVSDCTAPCRHVVNHSNTPLLVDFSAPHTARLHVSAGADAIELQAPPHALPAYQLLPIMVNNSTHPVVKRCSVKHATAGICN
jgi:hypothetical protein